MKITNTSAVILGAFMLASCSAKTETSTSKQEEKPSSLEETTSTEKSGDVVTTPVVLNDWKGTWIFEDENEAHTIALTEQKDKSYHVTWLTSGTQLYFEVEGKAVQLADGSLEIFFKKVMDGVFLPEKNIKKDKPVLIFRMNGKHVETDWLQYGVNQPRNNKRYFKQLKEILSP